MCVHESVERMRVCVCVRAKVSKSIFLFFIFFLVSDVHNSLTDAGMRVLVRACSREKLPRCACVCVCVT